MKYMLSNQFCATAGLRQDVCLHLAVQDYPKASYPNDLTRAMAAIAYHATAFAFDASDQMPGAVGTGSFWKQMTAWISGSTNLDSALKAIDASWPARASNRARGATCRRRHAPPRSRPLSLARVERRRRPVGKFLRP